MTLSPNGAASEGLRGLARLAGGPPGSVPGLPDDPGPRAEPYRQARSSLARPRPGARPARRGQGLVIASQTVCRKET